ncbi:MAG: putative membrane protein [Gammaproteobacteria bacterium]|jgi:uncharacterized membrane protein
MRHQPLLNHQVTLVLLSILNSKLELLVLLPIIFFAVLNIVTVNKNNAAYQFALSQRAALDKRNLSVSQSVNHIRLAMLKLSSAIDRLARDNQSMLLIQLLNSDSQLQDLVVEGRVAVRKQITKFETPTLSSK